MLVLALMLVKAVAVAAATYGGACVAHDVAAAVGKKVYSVY